MKGQKAIRAARMAISRQGMGSSGQYRATSRYPMGRDISQSFTSNTTPK